jgi:hypothetical protein
MTQSMGSLWSTVSWVVIYHMVLDLSMNSLHSHSYGSTLFMQGLPVLIHLPIYQLSSLSFNQYASISDK